MSTGMKLVLSDSPAEQLEGTIICRNLLREGGYASIQCVIDSGVVPTLISFIRINSSTRQLQFEAAWCLTNIAAGRYSHVDVLIFHGAVITFVEHIRLLATLHQDTRDDDVLWEQAVWFLGNIVATSTLHRDYVLDLGVLSPLFARLAWYLDKDDSASKLSIAAWTLSNFTRSNPKPEPLFKKVCSLSNFTRSNPEPLFEQMRPILPFLGQLIESNDEVVVSEACWALFELSNGPIGQIQAVIDTRVCRRLVDLLSNKSPSIIIPTLLTVGNIASGDVKQTRHVMNYKDLLPYLYEILGDTLLMRDDQIDIIRSGVYYTVSNMTAGNREQIQAVINSGIIDRVLFLFETSERNNKIKAIQVISNATSMGNHEQIFQLIIKGCIKPLCEMLQSQDAQTINRCLEGLENISRVGEAERNLGRSGGINMYVEMIKGGGGFERINMPYYDNEEIHKKAAKFRTDWLKTNDTPHLLSNNFYVNCVIFLVIALQFIGLLFM